MSIEPSSIVEILRAHGRDRPALPFIMAAGRKPLSYADMLRQADEVGATLSRHGISRKDRVALVLGNGPDLASAIVAVACHAISVPLNPAFTLAEWYRLFEDLQIDALISDSESGAKAVVVAKVLGLPVFHLRPRCDERAGCFDLDTETPAGDLSTEEQAPHAAAIAFLLPTSGTTSRPKAVPLTHDNICRSARNTGRSLALTIHDRLLNMLPLYHAHGLISGLMASLAAGASIVCTTGFSEREFFTWLRVFKPTWYTAVPTIHQAVLALAAEHRDAAGATTLRFIRSASASLPSSTLEGLERCFNVPVIETYGMTEAASQVASNSLPPKPRKARSVGPAAGPTIAIWDSEGAVLSAGEIGEIVLQGPNMTRAYLNDDAANEVAFVDGWFRTGDQGYLDQDGYLFITGRLKEMINRGGQNIAPREIEETLLTHAQVVQAVAFALPHPTLGEEVGAAVVPPAGACVDQDELQRLVATHLAPHKRPRKIITLDDIPKGPTGKLQRIGLAERLGLLGSDAPNAETSTTRSGELTETERRIREIWQDVLKIERIDRDDDFFLLGGDSLSAARVLSRIETGLHASIPLSTLFERSTIAALAACIDETELMHVDSTKGEDHASSAPLSYQQQSLYFLDRLTKGRSGHHVVDLVQVDGSVDVEALEQALAEMIRWHAVLRTVIQDCDGHLSQTVLDAMTTPFTVKAIAAEGDGKSNEARLTEDVRDDLRVSFDLEEGPLFRLRLLVLGDNRPILALTLHHLITDGWSQRLFWADFEKIYSALPDRRSLPPAGEDHRYLAFVRRQRTWVASPAADAQRLYWRRQLDGLTVLPLPTDRSRVQEAEGRGARHPLEFSRDRVRRLKSLGRQHRCTLFMTLLAAFQALLFRYTHHRDIAVGSLTANRIGPETEVLMGMLANTVLLRTDMRDDPTFETLLGNVRTTTIDAYRHQDLPFDEVLASTQLPRQADGRAAVPVMFLLQSPASKPPILGGANGSFVHVDPGWSRFDLTLELIEQEDGHLSGWFEYKTSLFEASTIERMAGHFLNFIDAALAEPTRSISSMPILDDAERQELLRVAAWTKAPRSKERSVIALFEDQVARAPEAIAVIGGDVRLSFEELDQRANQLAHHLADRGVVPGDFVGLMVGRSVEMVVALLGILKAGAAFVPLDPDYPEERLAFIIGDGGIRVIVTERMRVEPGLTKDLELVLLDGDDAAIASKPVDAPPMISMQDDVAYVLYTSGSTGQPKGVLGTHRGLLHILDWVWRALPFEQGEVCCHKTSISFGDALQELFAPLLRGHAVVVIEKEGLIDIERFVDCLAAHDIRRLVLVPSLLRAMLRALPDLSHRLPLLTLWISSGEALDAALARQFHARLPGRRLINIYGASEMADIVTWHEVADDDGGASNPPIGRPIDNVSVFVLDGKGQLLPRGVAGELCVASPGLAKGYHDRAELEAQVFIPNPFSRDEGERLYRTGDRVRLRADGALDYLGRIDQQVQIRGCRVELGEVERALEDHPAADQVAVLAPADEQDDRQLIAFVQPKSGKDLSAESLHDFVRKTLPTYMLPSRYDIVSALPLTPSGKVDRQRLKARESTTGVSVLSATSARSPTEEILLGIWSDLLKTEGLGVTDHFFECGGHSLLAGRVLARVQSAFGINLPLRSLFDHPTIAAFAPLVEAGRTGGPDHGMPSLAACPPEPAALPSRSQKHVLQVERSMPVLPAFNLPYAFRLEGPLDVEVFCKAVQHVVQRHEALRTRSSEVEGAAALAVDEQPAIRVKVDAIQCDIEQAVDIAKEEAWMSFAAGEDGLLRIRLLRLAPDDHVCLITIHHIIADGWSMGILVREISASYDAYRAGRSPHLLPDSPPAFSSFVAWQRLWCESDIAARQRAFWMEKLALEAETRRLAERPAKTGLSLSIAHTPIDLPGALRQRLITFARRHGGTLYMTLLAALLPMLAKLLDQSRPVVGTIVANRTRAETEPIFGPIENIVLLPLAADVDRSLADRIPEVREVVLDSASNQDLPFDDLANAWPRETYGPLTGLIDAMFVYQDAMRDTLDLTGIRTSPFGDVYRAGQPVFPISSADLTIILRDSPTGVIGSCVYKSDRIEEQQIEEMLRAFVDGLNRVA